MRWALTTRQDKLTCAPPVDSGRKWRDMYVHLSPATVAVADPFIPSGESEIKSMGDFMRTSNVPVCVVTNEVRGSVQYP